MSESITYPGASAPIVPDIVDGYEAGRESGTVVHPIAGRESPDATLAPARLRAGVLRLVFGDEVAAKAAVDAHALPVAFTFTSTDAPTVGMYYVVIDDVRPALDDATRDAWVVEVPFQEVAP